MFVLLPKDIDELIISIQNLKLLFDIHRDNKLTHLSGNFISYIKISSPACNMFIEPLFSLLFFQFSFLSVYNSGRCDYLDLPHIWTLIVGIFHHCVVKISSVVTMERKSVPKCWKYRNNLETVLKYLSIMAQVYQNLPDLF